MSPDIELGVLVHPILEIEAIIPDDMVRTKAYYILHLRQ